MKIIKFRAWDGEKMYPAASIDFRYPHPLALDNDTKENKHSVLMQFTGILDKNSKEIYDKDIVDYGYKKGIVVWHGEGWCVADLTVKCIEPKYEGKTPYEVWQENESCVEFDTIAIFNSTLPTVIGNVYSNPELLS
jgi:uncharacterized phage protein (TIGR01671 family)